MTEERSEKQSSIEVTCNAKGEHAFKVKFYFNEEVTVADEVVKLTKYTMDLLKTTFK